MKTEKSLKSAIIHAIKSLYNHSIDENLIQLSKTKKEFEGHLTLVVFPLLKISRKSPEQTAQEIGEYLLQQTNLVKHFNVVKGFLNLSIAHQLWISELQEIANNPNYGFKECKADAPLVMVEYSSPNTNKPLHLGHIRNNLLGFSLTRILKANGLNVVMTNIVNDRGIHICKSMLAWKKWGNNQTPASTNKKGDHLVGDFYVLFDKHYKEQIAELTQQGYSPEEATKKAPLILEAQEMLRRWESGDQEVISLWETMNGWVYEGFDQTYKHLGVSFDKIYYESQTYLVGKEVVLDGLKKGIFEQRPDGSVWANLEQEGLDQKLLLRSDGTSVYITQDIGTAKLRFDDYPINKMVYVVGNEQNYHFQVLAILLDKLGFDFGKELVHFSYGMVELPEGKMKSREGTVVDADDLMNEMELAAQEISQSLGKLDGLSPDEINKICKTVGLGALKYFILKVDPRKNMTFNPKESIDFNGNTGPFIQYTHARICSLLRKAEQNGITLPHNTSTSEVSLSDKEITLIQLLAEFANILQEAANQYNPSIIANYTYELVKEYNQFYHEYPILKESNKEVQSLRILLSKNVASTIKRAFYLLGIDVPERM